MNTGEFDSFQPISVREFSELVGKLRNKSSSSNSKIIYYIQTGVLANQETKPYNITIHFKAPLDDSSEEASKRNINYDKFRNVDELKLLKNGEFERYAYIQCLKICYYLQKVRRIELLKMTAEFVRDDHDNIWFVYANKINYRRMVKGLSEGLISEAEKEKQAMQFQNA